MPGISSSGGRSVRRKLVASFAMLDITEGSPRVDLPLEGEMPGRAKGGGKPQPPPSKIKTNEIQSRPKRRNRLRQPRTQPQRRDLFGKSGTVGDFNADTANGRRAAGGLETALWHF